jgi:hypothetical protein
MSEIIPCLCGAMPIIETKIIKQSIGKTHIWDMEVSKYRCPNCKNKELPWIDSRNFPRLWNSIAPKKSYHKRTLAYNECGVCIGEPFKVYEYKKSFQENVKVEFYLDNSMYYYCYDFWYKHHGSGFGLSISAPCFPTLEKAKMAAVRSLLRSDKGLLKIVSKLFFTPKQGELF